MIGRQSIKVRILYGTLYTLMGLLAMMTLFPFIHVLATSMSGSRAVMSGEVFLWPKEINFSSFSNLIDDGQLFKAMQNTVVITVLGTLFNIIATIIAAYPLSRKRLKGRNLILMLITFTMLFGGGLIPNYILIKTLGIMNTYWALWLPGLLSTYNFFVMKTFLKICLRNWKSRQRSMVLMTCSLFGKSFFRYRCLSLQHSRYFMR